MRLDLGNLSLRLRERSYKTPVAYRKGQLFFYGVFGVIILCLFGALLAPSVLATSYILAASRAADNEQKLALLEKSLQWSPDNIATYRSLALLYGQHEQFTVSVSMLEKAFRLQSDNIQVRQDLALAYEAVGDLQHADVMWRSIGMSDSTFLLLGEQSLNENRLTEAELWLDRASRMDGELLSSVHYFRAVLLSQQQQSEEAFNVLQQAIELDKGWIRPQIQFQAWYRWGTWLFARQQWDEAEKAFKQSILLAPNQDSIKPTLSESYRYLGLLQWQRSDFEEAIRNLQVSVRLNEQNVWAHIHYGKLLYLNNPRRVTMTEREFAAALDLQPENVEIWINLIEFWRWVKEDERATLLCSRASENGLIEIMTKECNTNGHLFKPSGVLGESTTRSI